MKYLSISEYHLYTTTECHQQQLYHTRRNHALRKQEMDRSLQLEPLGE